MELPPLRLRRCSSAPSRISLAAAAIIGVLTAPAAASGFDVLHRFTDIGSIDYLNPCCLMQAGDGNFYGVTQQRGPFNGGTIFKMTPSGVVTIVYAFDPAAGGAANPGAALIQATDGNFYGTTFAGGAHNLGTVFRMTPDGVLTVLHTFTGTGFDGDGGSPNTALVQATDGNFYGTTPGNGLAQNLGTIFRITPAGTFTVLHAFTGGSDGTRSSALIQATDGNLYGAWSGIFRISLAGTFTVLYTFGGTDSTLALAPLIQATDGYLYGTTKTFGGFNGSIFRMSLAGAFKLLAPDLPGGLSDPLIQASDGNFYGKTAGFIPILSHQCSPGKIFRMTPAGTVTFFEAVPDETLGYCAAPQGLIQASDRSLYGTTSTFAYRFTGLFPHASDDLVIDFGAFGVWMLFDSNMSVWSQLHAAHAKNIATGDVDGNGIDDIIVDFGSTYGIWVWANGWFQLHASTANRIVTGDLDGNGKADVVIDFPGAGIWVWNNNTSWSRLHAASADNIVTADLDGNGRKEAIIDFPGAGLWIWTDNTSWRQLHPLNSRLMTAGDIDGNGQADLVVDFAGYGLWSYSNNSTWAHVHAFDASHLAAGDVDGNGKSDLIVDFGNPYGIWVLANGSTWSQIHTLTSTNLLTADVDGDGKSEVIASFGTAGVWGFGNNTGWFQVHAASPGAIAVGHINAPGP